MSDSNIPNYGTPEYGTPPAVSGQGQQAAPAGNVAPSCSACGSAALEAGFIEDNGEGSRGFARWIPGALELGIFGGARRAGRQRFAIHSFRCLTCHHLDLYVGSAV